MTAAAFQAHYDGARPFAPVPSSGRGRPAWPAPDLSILTGGRTTPPVMPTDIFGSMWPLIRDLAAGAGAPVDYVGVSVLGVVASLVGAKRRVQPYPALNTFASVPAVPMNDSPTGSPWVSPIGTVRCG